MEALGGLSLFVCRRTQHCVQKLWAKVKAIVFVGIFYRDIRLLIVNAFVEKQKLIQRERRKRNQWVPEQTFRATLEKIINGCS